MDNATEIWSFVLAAYGEIGEIKYFYFSLTLLWYLSICTANTVLIIVIYVDRRLHEPMYILLCNLFVNEIAGSTSMYPILLSQLYSDIHMVSLPLCFLQMFYLYISASVEFCNLAAMAYDRYVAICCPLHYNVIMNTEKLFRIILFIWVYSVVNISIMFAFVFPFKFCGNIIDKVFCDFHSVVKLACSASVFDSISDLLSAFMTIALPFCLILISYMKILAVCLNASQENRQKAVATCSPQIVSVSNMFIGCIFHFVETRFAVAHAPNEVRILLSVYLLICQPIITPFMYGFKLPKIRQSCETFIFGRKI